MNLQIIKESNWVMVLKDGVVQESFMVDIFDDEIPVCVLQCITNIYLGEDDE